MSITVSIPDDVADEIYWRLDEMAFGRLSEKASTWLDNNFRNQVQRVWDKSAQHHMHADAALAAVKAGDTTPEIESVKPAGTQPRR